MHVENLDVLGCQQERSIEQNVESTEIGIATSLASLATIELVDHLPF